MINHGHHKEIYKELEKITDQYAILVGKAKEAGVIGLSSFNWDSKPILQVTVSEVAFFPYGSAIAGARFQGSYHLYFSIMDILYVVVGSDEEWKEAK